MLKTDEAHFEIALGPNNPSRLAKFRTGRQQIYNRTTRPAPAMLSALLLNPAKSPKFVGERWEAFQIQCQHEVDISCEPTDIHETKKGSSPR